jgi:hypothetical protein
MKVFFLIARPSSVIAYRFKHIPSTGRVLEKCAATSASFDGECCVYQAISLISIELLRRLRFENVFRLQKNGDGRMRLKNCQAGMRTSLRIDPLRMDVGVSTLSK